MVTLATAGFGLVAALAWNEAIQAFVTEYVDISRFIYAIIITAFAVFVTYQLTKISGEEDKSD